MADSDTRKPEETPSPRSHHWRRIFIAIGGGVVLAGGILGWLGWRELQRRLPALISEELSGALGRPIKLGELQRFGFTGLRFGETILPPTSENYTWARVQQTDIFLNPWDLILHRTFRPSLLLIRPEVAVKQRFDRQWVLERPNSVDDEGTIRTEIGRIRIRNAEVSIGPVTRTEIIETPEGISSAQLILLQNVNVNVHFRGADNEVVSLNVGGRLKNGTFHARGEGNLKSGDTNLTLQGTKLRIDTINPFLGGNLFLGEGYAYANLYTEVRPAQDPPVSIEGAARLQNGQAFVAGLPSDVEDIYGRLQFRGQRVAFDDTTLRFGPIQAEVRGSVSLRDGFQVGLLLPDVSVAQVETAFDQPLPVDAAGRFAIETRLLGPLLQPRVQGTVTNLSPVQVDRVGIDQVRAAFSGDADVLFLDDLRLLPSTGGAVTAKGQVNFRENLLRVRDLPPTAIALTANVDLPLDPLADLYDINVPVQWGRLTAVADISGPLLDPTAIANWQLQEGIAAGSGQVTYREDLVTLSDTRLTVADSGTVTAAGQANLASGQVALRADVRLPLDEIAQTAAIALPAGLTLGTLTAGVKGTGPLTNPTAEALWQLGGGSIPGQGRLTYADFLVTLRDTQFDLGSGSLSAAGQADLQSGFWAMGLFGSDLALEQIAPQLVGLADVEVQASGSLSDLSPAGIRASGDMTFSDGIPLAIAAANTLLDGPLSLAFDWDGNILDIPALTAPGLSVNGQVATRPAPDTGFPTPTAVDFAVRLTDYDLARLNALSPIADYALLRGRLDFSGTLQGPLQDPTVQGDLALRQTGLGDLALASDVSGTLSASPRQGGILDLTGENTELYAEVAPDLLPVSLLFRNGALLAEAQRQGDWLRGKVRNFPIQTLGIRPVQEPDLGGVGGILRSPPPPHRRSDFEVRLSTLWTNPTAHASFAIQRPSLGRFAAIALQGQLRLADWQVSLDNTFLDLPQSRFDLAARADLRSPRTAEARLTTRDAHIEDLLATLQLYDLSDLRNWLTPPPLGRAADLETVPIQSDPGDLLGQMLQAATARELQAQWEAEQASTLLPPLSALTGTFSADISLAASETTGVELAFDVQGQDWVWGQYDVPNQFIARGSLQDQVLTLAPIRLEAGAALVNLEGQLAVDGLNTQLEVANVQLAPIAQWLDLPLPVTGAVNALAHLTGTPGNPDLAGALTIADAAVNHYPLAIGSQFRYQDAWFRFDASVQGEPPAPLVVQGQIPYALPFMTVQPDSDELLVRASLASEGFALIDMFSPYVAWGGGDANLLIEATGPISEPNVYGMVEFQEASLTSEVLQDSLTGLTGTIGFGGDRLQVRDLRGTVLDGQFWVSGDLPFLTATAETSPPAQPLTLQLDSLTFNFEDEIVSQIDGDVIIGNALQSPTIGGAIALGHVRVNIGGATLGLARSLLKDPGLDVIVAEFREFLSQLETAPGTFDDFQISLPDPAKIRVVPLLSMDAIGAVTLSGPIVSPIADGSIELLEGWVNTITTTLSLEKAERRNLITFTPDDGLNPYFDLVFVGSLPLQRRYNLESNTEFALGNTSEVPDLDALASATVLDDIYIEAAIQGYFSDGLDLLQLSSVPSFPQDQLFSMLSGGYLSDLPTGEPAIALGANLLTAYFSDEQEAIADALGLQNFRLRAATNIPAGEFQDAFGIGAGVNVGITNNLSATFLQVLNQDQPYQLNLRYRLNRDLSVSGSTDFSDESRIFLQYRIAF